MPTTLEEFRATHGKPIKIKALKDGIIYANPQRKYVKGETLEAEFCGSMVFFLKGGESIDFYHFELV